MRTGGPGPLSSPQGLSDAPMSLYVRVCVVFLCAFVAYGFAPPLQFVREVWGHTLDSSDADDAIYVTSVL